MEKRNNVHWGVGRRRQNIGRFTIHVCILNTVVSTFAPCEGCYESGKPVRCTPSPAGVTAPPSTLSVSSACNKEVFCAHTSVGNASVYCAECAANEFGQNNLIDERFGSVDPDRSRWQSGLLSTRDQHQFVRVDFLRTYLLESVTISFYEAQPSAWYISVSTDFGASWTTAAFFASNCSRYNQQLSQSHANSGRPSPSNPDLPVCFSNSSSLDPSSPGYFHFLAGRVDPGQTKAQFLAAETFRRATNVQFVLDEINHQVPSNSSFFYYSAWNLDIQATCQCHGHAGGTCAPGGVCDCSHNTAGDDCGRCRDFYNDLPWQPSLPQQPFECKGEWVDIFIAKLGWSLNSVC